MSCTRTNPIRRCVYGGLYNCATIVAIPMVLQIVSLSDFVDTIVVSLENRDDHNDCEISKRYQSLDDVTIPIVYKVSTDIVVVLEIVGTGNNIVKRLDPSIH